MQFIDTPIHGAYVVSLEQHVDHRGFFAEAFTSKKFAERGLKAEINMCNVSGSEKAGTFRGFHYQIPPFAQSKLIRCIHGRAHDIIVDVRPDSPSYREHFAIELSQENRLAIYVPEMVAQGWIALSDGAEIMYLVGGHYSPSHERGLRWDDAALGIQWPIPVSCISEKDSTWPGISKPGNSEQGDARQ